MSTISESTKVSLPVVAVIGSVIAGGASWVSYITWRVNTIGESVARIERKMGIEVAGQGSYPADGARASESAGSN